MTGEKNIVVPTELVSDSYGTRLIALVPSSSGGKTYRVDTTHGQCDCPAWTFQRAPLAQRKACKHLRSLGYVDSEHVYSPVPSVKKQPGAQSIAQQALTDQDIYNAF